MKKDNSFFDYIFFESNKLNPLYNFYIVDNNKKSIININKNDNPPPANSPLVVKCIDNINTINNIKINIDKLNLCFLTEYLVDWEFIKINDINIFGYDTFLSSLLKDEKYKHNEIIKVVSYVVSKIKSNNYLDENNQPINNLLSYFKSSCLNNLSRDDKIEECFKEMGMY